MARTVYKEEHELFRRSVKAFIDREIAPHYEHWEKEGHVSREVWKKAGDAGLLLTDMPEKYGGGGADFLYSAVMIEEMARHVFTAPGFRLHSDIVAPYILNYGSEEQKRTWLPRMAKGEIQYPTKLLGVFEQRVRAPRSDLMRGFPDAFPCPVSRWTGIDPKGIERQPELRVLANSPETGIGLVEHVPTGDVFSLNHLEYDTDTLRNEFVRDLAHNRETPLPHNYFPSNSPAADPANTWRPYGYLMFWTWVTALYRDAPFDLADLSPRA